MKRINIYQDIIDSDNPYHAPIGETLAMSLTHVEEGKSIFTMNVDKRHLNSLGTI